MFVLFVDLCGFTRYSESHGERAAAELAARFAVRAMQAGRRAGVRPVTTVGDAVISVSREALPAARAALEILKEFGDGRFPLRVHAGVACGDVVERDGDIFGFPVNIAAHLADVSAPDQVLLTGDVVAELPSGFAFTSSGRHDVGMTRPIEVFRLDAVTCDEVA